MGMIAVLVGVGLGTPEAAGLAATGAAIYALHHGFAKGALFLGVGIVKLESDPGATAGSSQGWGSPPCPSPDCR
jgi:formate hydrogenlyase subunit 3/multisubunit Na+/H+ antiporter MnhD subunit